LAITRQQVLHIATLARLELDEAEVESFREDLDEILGYVEKLEQLDTTGVEPTTHAVELVMQLRGDAVEQRLTGDDVLGNAPDVADEHFRVPKVVED